MTPAGILAALLWPQVEAAAQTKSLPSITHLFQNNLDWTDDKNHVGALLLDPLGTYAEAESACKALGETLLPVSTFLSHSADFVPQFSYLTFQKRFTPSQEVWINNSVASVVNGHPAVKPLERLNFLPALCTQSSLGTTDGTSAVTDSNQITVQSKSNTFTGFRNLKSFRFLGIPFSDPVIRFRHSTVNSQTNHEFQATKAGAECFQVGANGASEQCLFLNIFTPFIPAVHSNSKLLKPVLFWIHGGAFTSGTGADGTFDGGNMASRGDVVMVTINYRLSTLGFLALSDSSITGNFGLNDQITALEWVRENIAAFGGDPNRITIMGQSAGAGSVRALMASPLARGKFAAAAPLSNLDGIDFSLTYSLYYTIPQEVAVAGNAVLQETGCGGTDPSTIESCLAQVDPAVLVNIPTTAKFVVVDGHVIVADGLNVTDPRAPGFTAQVPVLMGTMADDGAAFIGFPQGGESLTAAIDAILPAPLTSTAMQSGLFPQPSTGNTTLDMFNVTARISTDALFRCLDQATVFSAVKHKSLPAIWYYQFDRAYQTPGFNPNAPTCQPPPTDAHPLGDPSLLYFKCHSGDLYYQFGTLGQFGLQFRDDIDLPFSQLINDHWSSFVRTHDPNPDPAFLVARGFTTTLNAVTKAGRWEPVSAVKPTLRRLDFPTRQDGFQELEQCVTLNFPLDFYEHSVQTF